ncbi:MAG: glyoxalase/bleomycin resistance/dioxygenase family protein [Actinomycetota bacterium]|nr:MAG: glyoxalase/bleomycin resistance/dioxygenase family protein [Actinomycetota bacterium]
MSRVQLALNVSDLEASVAFYTRLFGVEPHKRRPGYANFAVIEPPLKLVLLETSVEARGSGVLGALNHLGVEVSDPAEVAAASDRLATAGLTTVDERGTTCCYAVQDKVWVHDPAGAPWEVYVVTDDAPQSPAHGPDGRRVLTTLNDGDCCTSSASSGAAAPQACC